MKSLLSGFFVMLVANVVFGVEAVDLTSPKLREVTVAKAQALVEAQKAPAVLATPLPNPFVRVPLKKSDDDVADETASAPLAPKAVPTLSGLELLTRLAALIPATGTMNLGGAPILLLGQKRLRVGDNLTINFEDKDYEVSIAAISPTAFTLTRGAHSHTRPLRLASATNSTSARP
jgi:hypothetical protein